MTIEEANYLSAGDRLRVSSRGLSRHDAQEASGEGSYVSQFESPGQGRLVVVKLESGGTFGFRLDELEVVRPRTPGKDA